MKAKKYENVEFVINHSDEDNLKLSLVWRKGGLYLSLSGLFLTDGSTWYELPVKDLENIHVLSDEPLKLRLKIPSLDVIISGQRAERLLALRHFLLPSISGKGEANALDSVLRFVALGIKEDSVISKLLGREEAEVGKLLESGVAEGYLTTDLELTEKGRKYISDREVEC